MNSKICKSCQSPADEETRFCADCGAFLLNSCSCGYQLSGSESFCPQCGNVTETSAHRNVKPDSGILPGLSVEPEAPNGRQADARLPEFTAGEELLDQYQVIEKIGSGGKGVVYRVLHLALNEEMAIKAVGSFDSIDSLLEEYRDEYKAQVGIRHEHILHVEAPVKLTKNNVNYLLLPMELARESFADWLHRHPLEDEQRLEKGLELFRQVCLGVQAIHEKGLAHLDLKPHNLLITGNEENPILKVTDFGLSRSMSQQDQRSSLYGDGIGTPAYMAPEQILAARWKDVGKEADIYALGMILYELLDGDLPYSGSAEQIKQKKRDASIKISTPDGPDHLVKAVMACLVREKPERLSDAKTLLNSIEGTKEESTSKTTREHSRANTYYDDDYKAWLRDKIEQSQIYFDGFLIQHSDVLSLFDQNLFSHTVFEEGKRHLQVRQKDLLHDPLPEAVHEIFSELDEEIKEKDEQYYLFLYANGEKEKAKYELDKSSSQAGLNDHFLTFSKAYAVLFDNQDTATLIIKELERNKVKAEDSSFWRECAEIWKEVLDDEREARRCLEKAERKAEYSHHWTDCARGWKKIFNDDREARRCLQQAVSKAEFTEYRIICAEAWKEIFDDDREARRHLQQAESKAEDSYDWRECARAWETIFDDEHEAERCVEKANSFPPPVPPPPQGIIVKSIICGTFYEAPLPDSDPFVKVGDQVKEGETLCIVETMGVMNEIVVEFSGIVKQKLVENGTDVDFDQPLFVIEKDEISFPPPTPPLPPPPLKKVVKSARIDTFHTQVKKVLIVEDDLVLNLLYLSYMEKLGFETEGELDYGKTAIETAKVVNPDLILMDISLEGDMDGIEAMLEIRKFSSVPVVYITGNSDRAQQERAEATDYTDYLIKPVEFDELKACLLKANIIQK